jgi:hypothetical protein
LQRDLEQISVALNHFRVVAALVPATSNLKAQSNDNRGGRDKLGHDPGGEGACSNLTGIRSGTTTRDALLAVRSPRHAHRLTEL